MGESSTQAVARPSCEYGQECYRTNPNHRVEKAHPGDDDYQVPRMPSPVQGAPKCKYGRRCYRKNADHFRNFRHPRPVARTSDQYLDDDEEDDSDFDPFAGSSGSDYVPSEEDE
uniref:PBZ-type domain-containing protein n=1 Tax=Musca domestica TaxID=7370 RepID=A0A1I8MB37_MUSDO